MLSSDSPVELGLKKGELAGDLYGMEGHQVEGVHLARSADVPLDGRGRALEGDVVTDTVGLRLQLPLDDLVDGLHPLPHRLACKQETRDSLAAVHKICGIRRKSKDYRECRQLGPRSWILLVMYSSS